MDRTHLRREDCPPIALHVFAVNGAVIDRVLHLRYDMPLAAEIHSGNQTADANARCAEVADLVDLQYCVEFAALLEYFSYLVSRYRVKTAAK